MMMFKKHSVSFLNEKWEVLRGNIKLTHLPRAHELVYLPEYNKYFRVANVIHNFESKKQGVFVIIEQYTDNALKNKNK